MSLSATGRYETTSPDRILTTNCDSDSSEKGALHLQLVMLQATRSRIAIITRSCSYNGKSACLFHFMAGLRSNEKIRANIVGILHGLSCHPNLHVLGCPGIKPGRRRQIANMSMKLKHHEPLLDSDPHISPPITSSMGKPRDCPTSYQPKKTKNSQNNNSNRCMSLRSLY